MTGIGLAFGFGGRPQAAACTGECQKSGPLGLLVILLLCVACYFLFKSMSKHLKRVRENFPQPVPPAARPVPPAPSVDLVKRADVVKRAGAPANGPAAPPSGPPAPPPGSTGPPESQP